MGNIQKHVWYATVLVLYLTYFFTDMAVFKILGHVMLSINFMFLYGALIIISILSTATHSKRIDEEVDKFYISLVEEFSLYNVILSIAIVTLLVYFGNLVFAGLLFILTVLITTFYNRGINLIENEITE